jgi:hypothetical protein
VCVPSVAPHRLNMAHGKSAQAPRDSEGEVLIWSGDVPAEILSLSGVVIAKELFEEFSIDIIVSTGIPNLHQILTLWPCEDCRIFHTYLLCWVSRNDCNTRNNTPGTNTGILIYNLMFSEDIQDFAL